MKKLGLILLLLVSTFTIQASIDDTVKIYPNHISIKSTIAKVLQRSIYDQRFDSLAPFCNSSVDFYFQSATETYRESSTEWKAISNLNDLIVKVPYSFFTIKSGVSDIGVLVFMVELFEHDEMDKLPLVSIYFAFDEKEAVEAVLVVIE